MFSNRQQAGSLLTCKIIDWLHANGRIDNAQIIVMALPRGGVPVALEIAVSLGCPLNVLASKKIGAPDQKELAIGAVTSSGVTVIDEILSNYLNISPDYINKEKDYLINKSQLLEKRWRVSAGIESELDLEDKTVIVVDDGVATGMTAIAAARSLIQQGASSIIFATPVISSHALNRLLHEYTQVIALETSSNFTSVGQFYLDFNQVEDLEVVRSLAHAMNRNCLKLV